MAPQPTRKVVPLAARKLTAVKADELRNQSRSEFVFARLRDAIWEGSFTGGERIPEEEIAHLLGVSRTPVREALRRLQERGLITVGAGRSLVVAELSQSQVLELYAMREILEGSAARFAARHANDAEIDLLNRVLDELEKHGEDARALISLNRRFHRTICEAAHNRYLIQTLDGMHDALALLHSNTFRVPNRRTLSDTEHRRIVQAIARRDADEAEQAARDHVRQAQRTRMLAE
jgi:DNA-binding GntR family transcriptional regulator